MDKWESLKAILLHTVDEGEFNSTITKTLQYVHELMIDMETAELIDCSMPEVVDCRNLKDED